MEREAQGTSRMQSPTRLSSASWRSAALTPRARLLAGSSTLSGRAFHKALPSAVVLGSFCPVRNSSEDRGQKGTVFTGWDASRPVPLALRILPVSHSGVYSEGKIISKMDSFKGEKPSVTWTSKDKNYVSRESRTSLAPGFFFPPQK